MRAMRFKRLSFLLVFILIMSCAAAESAPSSSLFSTAKSALQLIAAGDDDGALSKIDFQFSSDKYSEDGFKQCVERYLPDIRNTAGQTDVAVCYWEGIGSRWLIAVPVTEPNSKDVLCLVLMSSDKKVFDGYAVLTWAEVTDGTTHSDWVWWSNEYRGGERSLYSD